MQSFNLCPMIGFICVKSILITYNNLFINKKYLNEIDINEYIQRPEFFESVLGDFNEIANDLDFKFLNKLYANTEAKLDNSSNRTKVIMHSYNNKVLDICDRYSNDVKFKYMVRQDFTMNDFTMNIKSILVHPITAIRIAVLISKKFGSIFRICYNDFIKKDIIKKDIITIELQIDEYIPIVLENEINKINEDNEEKKCSFYAL